MQFAQYGHCVVVVCLDRGYLSPEYASFGHISTAIDTFSFGIVVLEIISGRKNIDFEKPQGQHILLQWVRIYSFLSNHLWWLHFGLVIIWIVYI